MTHSYAGTVAFFINSNWLLVERVVDFKVVGELEHQAAYAAYNFMESARKRGGGNKMSGYVSRNVLILTLSSHVLAHHG
jgi:hypothetical protein